jgi:hypothetical protein
MSVVLGFLLAPRCRSSGVCPHRSGRLHWRSIGRFKPGGCRIGWNSVERTHVFYSCRLVTEGAFQSSAGGYYHGARFRSVVLAENDMEAEICGLAMVTRVWVARRNWLRDRCLWSNDMRVGATAQEKFKILPFRVKIQGLALIGCAWQCSC